MAHLLPSAVRLRVFEPAYHDMLANAAGRQRGRGWLTLRTGLLAIDSFRVALPRLAWTALRTSRRVQIAIAVILLALLGLLIQAGLGGDGPPQRY